MTHLPHQEIEELWAGIRHLAEERLALIEHVVEISKTAAPDPAAVEEARRAAHNLAGSLGSFHRPDGSRAARHAEDALTPPSIDRDRLIEAVTHLRAALQ
ncbi:Hpt domain-containing protein [Streptomyces sp. NPDC086081]|uniref:Hpt domain-containing protein n=1 Tax=Streptomyces sp. NPDC086081 TaxID=3365749 RepID=UPI00382EEF6C